jgi:hypothetical protein
LALPLEILAETFFFCLPFEESLLVTGHPQTQRCPPFSLRSVSTVEEHCPHNAQALEFPLFPSCPLFRIGSFQPLSWTGREI